MTDEKKPTRRVAVSYKGSTAVIHWGRYMMPTGPKTDNDRLWMIGMTKTWVPDCDRRYTRYSPTALDPKVKPRVTCKKCVAAWGNGVKK